MGGGGRGLDRLAGAAAFPKKKNGRLNDDKILTLVEIGPHKKR